jgi:small subunit ribosomal protein S20
LTRSRQPTISIANPAAVHAAAAFSAAGEATEHRWPTPNRPRRPRARSRIAPRSTKRAVDAISSGNKTAAQAALVAAEPALMRAARNGIIHKKSASRKVSRLTHRIAKLG